MLRFVLENDRWWESQSPHEIKSPQRQYGQLSTQIPPERNDHSPKSTA